MIRLRMDAAEHKMPRLFPTLVTGSLIIVAFFCYGHHG
jgi:hypothetical protein